MSDFEAPPGMEDNVRELNELVVREANDFMSEFEVSIEEAAEYDDPEWCYENLVIKCHMSVIVAAPNAGKTTIFMHEVCPKLVKAGYEVIYVNADVGQSDAKSMVTHAEKHGYRLLLPDMKQGRSMLSFVEELNAANDSGRTFPNTVFIFDTLKKMTDVINKSRAKELYILLRSMSAKGSTVVALAHTNKYNDAEGNPIYEGTADLRSDFDDLIYLIPETHEDGSQTVSTKPDKKRGHFEPISFEIDEDRNVTPCEYVDVAEKIMAREQLEKDSPVIELITQAIKAGDFTEAKIVENCKEHHVGWRTVRGVLRRYTGKKWGMELAFKNNAKQYFLIDSTPP